MSKQPSPQHFAVMVIIRILVLSTTNSTNALRKCTYKYNKYIVHFLSKTFGVREAESNPVRSSISDQCYFYAKCNKNVSTRACFYKFLGEQNNP